MVRRVWLAGLLGLWLASAATAQTGPWRFHWQTGQVLTYRVEQTVTSTEEVKGNRSENKVKLNLNKRWQVQDVDAQGVATLQLSLTALRWEKVSPTGEVMFFDSANLDKSDAALRNMSRFVGQPVAVLRVDGQGRVVEVKESKYGSANEYENRLPFIVTLPDAQPQVGQNWERTYKVTLDPPMGTGEKYDAVQTCACKAVTGGVGTMTVTASIKTPPTAVDDQMPLLHTQPEGEAVFDIQAGRLQSATLRIDKELKDQQGEGSRFQYKSTYTEQYTGAQ